MNMTDIIEILRNEIKTDEELKKQYLTIPSLRRYFDGRIAATRHALNLIGIIL